MCNAEGKTECEGLAAPAGRSAERPGGGGGETALRLDKRTYLDREQGRWRLVLRDFGGGLCEIGWSFVAALRRKSAGRGDSGQRTAMEDRAVRRARSRLRHLVLASNADHLLTLTYRSNVTAFGKATADLARFIRRVRRQLPGWVYIAVPEQQQRGAWHWHLAVIGRQDVALLRAGWRGVIREGNIDVQQPRLGGLNRRLGLVRYLGKYLAKGFADGIRELNGHRFRASLGIKVPRESIVVPVVSRAAVASFALQTLQGRTGSVGHTWVADDQLAGWACSWE